MTAGPSPTNLSALDPYDEDGNVRIVVETPRGSPYKIRYDESTGAFTYQRPLPAGTVYPFDWGFVPGTLGDDGDPVDALVVHDGATYPGVVFACRLVGVLRATQRGDATRGAHERLSNPRLLAVPARGRWRAQRLAAVPEEGRREIEAFFQTAVLHEHKEVRLGRWEGPAAARKLVSQGRAAYSRR